MSAEHPVKLTIVIPALNEEEAIGSTIERCLAARARIISDTRVNEVQVVVVSDGSTDRTPEIARSYDEADLIVFPENRGYGAAIKAGWELGGGDLLGFLDADGTCDPEAFVSMCREILDRGQDVVLGCRMGKGSRMPLLRRFGNTLFAILLGMLSRKSVRDTASGMRVIRRASLPSLLPLPDGLHFTPAMSARALMDDEIQITEVDMHYEERIGESKLSVLRDGLRFLNVIISAAAYTKASRLTMPLLLIVLLAAAALMAGPAIKYAREWRLEEWMFYRFTLAATLGMIGTTLLCVTIVVEHVVALAMRRYGHYQERTRGLWQYENLRILALMGTVAWLFGVLLNLKGLTDLLFTGQVTLHWSRVIAGATSSVILAQLIGAWAALKIIRALHQRQPFNLDTQITP